MEEITPSLFAENTTMLPIRGVKSNTHFSVECHTKMLVCFLASKLCGHLAFVFMNCYFTIGNFQNEPIWKTWCTFAFKFHKTKIDMEVISIERSTYEELQASFNSFVAQMKAMGSRGKDKRLGEWLVHQDMCRILNISPRTLQTLRDNGTLAYSQIERKIYYKPEDVKTL